MTATVSGPSWAATHRVLLAVVTLAVAVAIAAAVAIVLITASGPASTAPSIAPAEQELTDTQRACQLARVVGC